MNTERIASWVARIAGTALIFMAGWFLGAGDYGIMALSAVLAVGWAYVDYRIVRKNWRN